MSLEVSKETALNCNKPTWDQFGGLCDAALRVDEPLEWFSLDDSSLRTDLGLCFCLGLGVLGLTRPCSSKISCCFLLRYSCLISSRRVFSSSLRRRSSSAFRLAQDKQRYVSPFSSQSSIDITASNRYRPHFVSLELRFSLQLLLADTGLFSFLLLLQQKSGPLLGQFVLSFLLILNRYKN